VEAGAAGKAAHGRPVAASNHVPRLAMVLAAGFGTRLKPITETTPKPMVVVAGRPMIDTVLDRLAAIGVQDVVVNTHHLAEVIESHLRKRTSPHIQISREGEILETGGGVTKALPLLGADPFYVINGKIVWLNGKTDALIRLAEAWDDGRMDALLLLHPTATAVGYGGPGDFFLDQLGAIRRRRHWEVAAFSLNILYDRAIEAGRLFGIRHDGEWFQVSTPQQLAEVEARIAHGIERYI